MIARMSAADSMPTPSGGPVKSGSARSQSGVATCELPHDRHQHEDAPQAVDDRRNRREQLGQEHQRLPQPGRRQLGDVDGDAERDRRRDDQRQDRRVERAPDERPRAELAEHRIPVSVCQNCQPNCWIDSRDCANSATPIADDDGDEQQGEHAGAAAEERPRRNGRPNAAATSHTACTCRQRLQLHVDDRPAAAVRSRAPRELLAVGERPAS